jgi:hypothetical protein
VGHGQIQEEQDGKHRDASYGHHRRHRVRALFETRESDDQLQPRDHFAF